ncbi:MAG: hypothetical protein COB77_01660 [Gammaproteobacteria bacterium]|nr:MAG: hypothetical protein COB77_01660 [Gammaproteobacteria bacterium]
MHNAINACIKTFFILAISLGSVNTFAENSQEFGDYVIHYNAFRSDTISTEVAKQYGLTRANNRVLINIAVLKKVLNTTGKPTSSVITGHASNLTGQLKQLEFKEIKEGTAIYYLADTKISDGEFLKFNIKIIPEGETRAARLKFDKRFFTY